MAHATAVSSSNSTCPVRTRTAGKPFIAKPASRSSVDLPAEEEGYNTSDSRETKAAKQAIMQQVAAQNKNNSLLARLHAERLARQQVGVSGAQPQQAVAAPTPAAQQAAAASSPNITELKLLTYNVW